MYLRITKRRNKDGTEVRYYQLAENVWNAARGHAVAKVIYNFGRADELDHDDLRRLASSILRVVGDGNIAGDAVTIRDAWPYGVVWVIEQIWSLPARICGYPERRSGRFTRNFHALSHLPGPPNFEPESGM